MKTEINILLDFEANARPADFERIFRYNWRQLWNVFSLQSNYSALELYRRLNDNQAAMLEDYLESCLIAG